MKIAGILTILIGLTISISLITQFPSEWKTLSTFWKVAGSTVCLAGLLLVGKGIKLTKEEN